MIQCGANKATEAPGTTIRHNTTTCLKKLRALPKRDLLSTQLAACKSQLHTYGIGRVYFSRYAPLRHSSTGQSSRRPETRGATSRLPRYASLYVPSTWYYFIFFHRLIGMRSAELPASQPRSEQAKQLRV